MKSTLVSSLLALAVLVCATFVPTTYAQANPPTLPELAAKVDILMKRHGGYTKELKTCGPKRASWIRAELKRIEEKLDEALANTGCARYKSPDGKLVPISVKVITKCLEQKAEVAKDAIKVTEHLRDVLLNHQNVNAMSKGILGNTPSGSVDISLTNNGSDLPDIDISFEVEGPKANRAPVVSPFVPPLSVELEEHKQALSWWKALGIAGLAAGAAGFLTELAVKKEQRDDSFVGPETALVSGLTFTGVLATVLIIQW